ncbi:hypothetical protein P22_3643 [Propionispora sp. 2/2-37]|uniref:hypothetical protein n=1 Tax=Propionispora sp. 2/2-37 TaxID=1677858 RepID=UPI0006C2AD6A|nr:hypothetical protein [Propionispora sp. 2/2-37]CUH97512.1 hypothetical protein P22_3643 [Propionispora sp. 2/2-37]
MKITFPHTGNMYIPIKVLLETIGIDYVMPPLCNIKTLECGSAHSPEFICMPFKIILGDFIHGIQNGADTVLFCGGLGQCRLGYYGDLQAEILKSIGHNVKFICIDLTFLTVREIVEKLKPLTEGKSPVKILRGIACAIWTVFRVDKLYRLASYTRCREVVKGCTDNTMKQFHHRVQNARGFKAIIKEINWAKWTLETIKTDKKAKPLKVAIVGELYVALEPYANLDIEKKLGNMGVEVHNKLSVSHWIMEHFIKRNLPVKSKDTSHEAGKEFMKTDDIGGHGLETIGNAVLCSRNRYDGIIHLYPFTCMPEIIAQCTFNEIQNKYGVPIMTLILDEMTGEAGYMTRVEAFIDMLERKRKAGTPDRILNLAWMFNWHGFVNYINRGGNMLLKRRNRKNGSKETAT